MKTLKDLLEESKKEFGKLPNSKMTTIDYIQYYMITVAEVMAKEIMLKEKVNRSEFPIGSDERKELTVWEQARDQLKQNIKQFLNK